jgi:hypothetical protein
MLSSAPEGDLPWSSDIVYMLMRDFSFFLPIAKLWHVYYRKRSPAYSITDVEKSLEYEVFEPSRPQRRLISLALSSAALPLGPRIVAAGDNTLRSLSGTDSLVKRSGHSIHGRTTTKCRCKDPIDKELSLKNIYCVEEPFGSSGRR